jgi:hypothetical protein
MGDLPWMHRSYFTLPAEALRHHIVCLGASGSGKTETLLRLAYGARATYQYQVIYLDAKGEEKQAAEQEADTAARFVATMRAAGAQRIALFPATHYQGWLGSPTALTNRLLSVLDFSESPYYGDVAANAVYLALHTPTTPRSSRAFLANLRPERLEACYKDHPGVLERVRRLLEQVRMRYEVFFQTVRGQLDGSLTYTDADAVYLRVQGFALRQEAPRLGRFLVYDFMHYIAERRRAGLLTLLIIDEFNALRLREEISVLFEQVRSFGGSLVIAAQGYAGLGPTEYANRILDAANTYILHSGSYPFPVAKRAGKRLCVETAWSEDDQQAGNARKQTHSHWEWKVPENAVMQQSEGQAYWINRGRAQQVFTARVPLSSEQIRDAWVFIREQEAAQRALRTQIRQQQALSTDEQQRPP